jgi:hypothetical protein
LDKFTLNPTLTERQYKMALAADKQNDH